MTFPHDLYSLTLELRGFGILQLQLRGHNSHRVALDSQRNK